MPARNIIKIKEVRIVSNDFESIIENFRECPAMPLRQDWLATPDSNFEPGWVKLGFSGHNLLVLAELTDSDIFSTVTKFNDPARRGSDTFEIILRPVNQQRYNEVHIAPNNILSQYLFPNQPDFMADVPGKTLDYIIAKYGFAQKYLDSMTAVHSDKNMWRVFASIDISVITQNYQAGVEQRLLANLCRYNNNHSWPQPQLSSASRLTALQFHNQDEWDMLVIPAVS